MATTNEKVANLKRTQLTCSHVFDDGRRCGLLAGVGQKTCVRHGAKSGYAGLLGEQNSLSNIYLAWQLREDKLDLSGELALQRTMLSSVLLKLKNKKLESMPEGALMGLTSFINEVAIEIGKTVKVMADVESKATDSVHVTDIKMVIDGIIEILFEAGIDNKTMGVIAERLDKLTLPIELQDVVAA